MGHNKLTAKQEKFAQLVAQGKTYADAYRGSYSAKKTAVKTIWENSSRLMADSKVKARVAEIQKETAKRNEVTVDQVLEQLKNWLLFDPLEIIDEDTDAVKMLRDMPKEARMSLSEIHVQEIWGMEENASGKRVRTKIGELKKIKFIDKRAVSDQFMKKFGQYIGDKDKTDDTLSHIAEIVNGINALKDSGK